VVAAANYAARRYGIHSAMPARTARRLCPELVCLPPRLGYYAEVSHRLRAIFARYTPLVEPLSLDEAFLDLHGGECLFGPPIAVARRIKHEVATELALVASVGVAPNKFVAKIASDLEKPDAFVVVAPDAVQAFLDPLPVGRIWGVGKVASRVFQDQGIHTIADLRRLSLDALQRRFGSAAEHLWEMARGIDTRSVVSDRRAKSISQETTFPSDVVATRVLQAWLRQLTELVAWRLRQHRLQARTVQIKVRFADFRTIARAQRLERPTHNTGLLWESALGLLDDRLPTPRPPVRLLGVGVSGLASEAAEQGELFDDPRQQRQARLDGVADQIRARFGPGALRRGLPPESEA
jgi:DNA polymerase-4